jgi:hypothetical protein
MSVHSGWDKWAELIDGKVIKIDGIEVKLEVEKSQFPELGIYSAKVNGHPTAAGKRHPSYIEKKRQYRDDWSMSWEGELPEEICRLFSNLSI